MGAYIPYEWNEEKLEMVTNKIHSMISENMKMADILEELELVLDVTKSRMSHIWNGYYGEESLKEKLPFDIKEIREKTRQKNAKIIKRPKGISKDRFKRDVQIYKTYTEKHKSTKEIGAMYEITHQRVSQIVNDIAKLNPTMHRDNLKIMPNRELSQDEISVIREHFEIMLDNGFKKKYIYDELARLHSLKPQKVSKIILSRY